MLLIRPAQMAALDHAYRHLSIAALVRQRPGNLLAGISPEEVCRIVIAADEQAATYHVTMLEDVGYFVSLVLQFGPGLASGRAPAWMMALLRHPLLTGADKIRQIAARLGPGHA